MYQMKRTDAEFYNRYIRDYIPDVLYDAHAHLWTDAHITDREQGGTADWVHNFCRDNSMSLETMRKAYADLFAEKKVKTLAFGWVERGVDVAANNRYVGQAAQRGAIKGLAVTKPEFGAERLEEEVAGNGLTGMKPYPNFAPAHIPPREVRITDMVSAEQLAQANERGWVLLLHIPRPGRLADRQNIEDLLMIDKEYPNIRLIVAHIGRAYCPENIGEAFTLLKATKNMLFDFAAHTNSEVFEEAIRVFGAKRLLFGTDLPITYMRLTRKHINGNYVNYVPAGSCGDVSADPHMREVSGKEAESITFFVYESIAAMIRAAQNTGLKQKDIECIFYQNAADLLG